MINNKISQGTVSIADADNKMSLANQPYLAKTTLGRRGLERLDLLLLVIEALDLNGSQAMLWTSNSLGLDVYFPNPVELWKYRCHNPLRRATRRGILEPAQSEALILLICSMSERIYPTLRQLISSKEPEITNMNKWKLFSSRFNDLIEERFNIRRSAVQKLLSKENNDQYIRQLVLTLALSVGTGGVDRLRASLLDSKY